MSDDVLVKVDNVSKRFCRSLKRSLWYGLQDLGSEIGGRRHAGGGRLPQSSKDVQLRPDEFWAVKDVSFELRRGECLGLIGRNGAGKTTLLRMLNGLIKPDTGRIKMRGRTGALIALGTGFNPLLTGRENIAINASVLGMSSAEIKAALDEIIEFSEINDFIDSPVQNYSSGMQVRLGFAIATYAKPDILIIDEILAVGDRAFRDKCYRRIQDCKDKGTAIFYVSHSEASVRCLADYGLFLKNGITIIQGDLDSVFDEYLESDYSGGNTPNTIGKHTSILPGERSEIVYTVQNISPSMHESLKLESFSMIFDNDSCKYFEGSPFTIAVKVWGADVNHLGGHLLHFAIKGREEILVHKAVEISIPTDLQEYVTISLTFPALNLCKGQYSCKTFITRFNSKGPASLPLCATEDIPLVVHRDPHASCIDYGLVTSKAIVKIVNNMVPKLI